MRKIKFYVTKSDGTKVQITFTKKEFEVTVSLLNTLSIIFSNADFSKFEKISKNLDATADFIEDMYKDEFKILEEGK